MRSRVLLLALGLYVADTALASPCKPRHSYSLTSSTASIASTTQSTSASEATSTILSPAQSYTSSAVDFSNSVASTTQSTSLNGETSTSVTPGTPIESTTSSTPVALSTTTTPVITPSSTPSSAASSTTPAPVATPTFTIVGGSGAVNGAPLQGVDQAGSILLFNPATGNSATRTFILDPNTGRLRDKNTGNLVCAYYGSAAYPSDPANIGYCQDGNTGQNAFYDYLTCQVISGKLACTAPRASCPEDDNGLPTCFTDPGSGINNQFYYQNRPGAGDYLYISSGSPGGYTSVDLVTQT